MQIEHYLDPLGWAAVAGFVLGFCWFAIYLFGWAWDWAWSWIDDSEASSRNPVIRWVMARRGWQEGEYGGYEKGGERSFGESAFFCPLIFFVTGPVFALLAITFYPVTIGLICLYLIARLARFARRHKKLFDKHVKDPDAHRE